MDKYYIMINLSIKYYYGSHFFGIRPEKTTQGNLSPDAYTPIPSHFEPIQWKRSNNDEQLF